MLSLFSQDIDRTSGTNNTEAKTFDNFIGKFDLFDKYRNEHTWHVV